MHKIIIVGLGDYYRNIVRPSLHELAEEGRVEIVATVDIIPFDEGEVPHLIRSGQPLSELLAPFAGENVVVILAHANHMHVPDAIDLISHGFRVALEKPYALNKEALYSFYNTDPSKYYLLEYYLSMKSVPLLAGYGLIDKKSFYFDDNLLQPLEWLNSKGQTIENFIGSLPALLGDPLYIKTDLLEGSGLAGVLDHRGVSLVDIRAGGGMLQDLGIHALAPVYAVGGFVGSILYEPHDKIVKIARCLEYVTMAKQKFGLEDKYIGETYAEFDLRSKTGVPISVRVGKYVYGDRNSRGITIQGSRSRIHLDLDTTILSINGVPAVSIKKDKSKYYNVLRSMLAFFEGEPLYHFHPNKASAKAQEAIINAQNEAYRTGHLKHYAHGIDPDSIFSI